MSISKRIICILLSLALLLTWPGFAQQADAVAGVDDAALAVGLLFCTWAGVTFASNQGAATAVGNFLNSSVSGLKACTEVAAKYLVDGQLKLVQGVKDAFNSILPDINSTFKTTADSNSGILVGSVPIGVPLEASAYADNDSLLSDLPVLCSGGATLTFNTPRGRCTLTARLTDSFTVKARSSASSICGGFTYSVSYDSSITSVGFCFLGSGVALVFRQLHKGSLSTRIQPLTCYDGFSYSDAVYTCDNEPLSSTDTVDFNRSKEIDGTQAANALAGTDFGDGHDRNLDIAALLAAIAAGLAGSAVAPGLSPADLIEILKKALYIPGTGAEVLPTEVPDVTEDTQPDPSEDPDDDKPSFNPLPPDQFNFFGDAFEKVNTGLERIGDRLQQLQDGILPQIELFKDAVTQGFIDVGNWFSALGNSLLDGLKSLGENLATGLKSLYDTLHEFATQTFPQWVADAKAWALALPGTITNAVKQAFSDAFVPSPGYMDDKIDALKAQFPFFFSIMETGNFLKGFLAGLGQKPPIIYIDLTNSTWAMGGKIPFIDLTWYAQYKPTMDTVLSAFLWLLFLWRLFLLLPSIVEGLPGYPGSSSVAPEQLALPPGHESLFYGPPSNTDQRRLP